MLQFAFVADNVVMITPLPDRPWRRECQAAARLRNRRFEIANDRAQRIGLQCRACIAAIRVVGGRNADEAMKVVGHDDIQVEFHSRSDDGGFAPFVFDQAAQVVEAHGAVNYAPEEAGGFVRADGDEVDAGMGVVMVAQAVCLASGNGSDVTVNERTPKTELTDTV